MGNFLKIAGILEVSLAELALAMGYEVEEKLLKECIRKSDYTPVQNEALEIDSVPVANDNLGYRPLEERSKGNGTGSELIEISLAELLIEHEAGKEFVLMCRKKSADTPGQNEALEIDSLQLANNNAECTPAKRRAKGEGTGFVEERLVKRGEKEYKQYWFHWQKSAPGKKRVLTKSKYIPKELVDEIIEKNRQKLPVREILQILGV